MLVLHFNREFRSLPDLFAVPVKGISGHRGRAACRHIDIEPLVQEQSAGFDLFGAAACDGCVEVSDRNLLDLVDDSVVLRMENGVDRGEGDVFVAPTVADDEVSVEQFIVVGQFAAAGVCCDGVAGNRVGVRTHHGVWGRRIAIDVGNRSGNGVVSDVIQEGMAGAQHIG